MKSFSHSILFVLIACSVGFAQVDRSKLPEPGKAKPVEIGNYKSFVLKNGLKVFVIENHKLPRVSFRLQLNRLPLLEEDKAGYLGMVGDLMNRGTTKRKKEQIDEEVDFIGASLSVSSTGAFASGLSKYKEKILELMADVVLNPTFPEAELEKIKKQSISAIEANKDDPAAVSSNLISKVVYGPDHPYGEVATKETIQNVSTGDIRKYHDTYYRPNIAYLAVVGDVNFKETKKLIQAYFGKWEAKDVAKPTYSDPKKPEKNVVALVNRPSSVQSVINVTYPVKLLPASKDGIPVDVMMEILGGSFASRLNMNLREDKGYTYGIRASLPENRLISRFEADASVRNEVTDSAVTQILYEMELMGEKQVTDEELELAQNSLAGSFARSLESPQTVASFAINTERYNLPSDYYATYIQKIQSVTKEEVKAVAERYVLPGQAYITVVGKGSNIEKGLKEFGEIRYFDTNGDPVDPALAKLPSGLTAEKVLEDYFAAIGGRDRLAQVQSAKIVTKASAMGSELVVTKIVKSPKKLSLKVTMGGNVMSEQTFDGENAKVIQMGNNVPVSDKDRLKLEMEAFVFPELYLTDMGAKLDLVGMEQVTGKDAYIVEVKLPDGTSSTMFFDSETKLLVRKSQVLEVNGQTMTLNTDFGNYEEVEGIKFPKTIKIPLGPGVQGEGKVESVEINAAIEDKIFSIE